MLVESLCRTPELRSLPVRQGQVVTALRLWIAAIRCGRAPANVVADLLGCARAAAHLHLLLEEIGAAWPDPFCVSPPCCPRLSHDEALVAGMMAHAESRDRPGFDRLLCDLLSGDVRERLFLSSVVLHRAMRT